MNRRGFLAIATAMALPRIGRAQKTPVVGLLWNDSVKPSPYVGVLSEALARWPRTRRSSCARRST
jgi:hypothetical protein